MQMRLQLALLRLVKVFDASPAILAVSVLLLAVALFGVLFGVIWAFQHFTGVFAEAQRLADAIGIETHRLLEFIGLFVGVTILVGQLWLTHRRVSAAESTAQAAQETAESTALSNSAQQFREAVASLSSPSMIVRLGGVQDLGIIARNYPEYRDAVSNIIAEYVLQQSSSAGNEG